MKPSELPTESGWYQTRFWDYALLLDREGRWWWDGKFIDPIRVADKFAPLVRLVPAQELAAV